MWCVQEKTVSIRKVLERYASQLRILWDILNIGVIGLNSFILLLLKAGYHKGINYVICAGAGAYVGSLLIQAVLFPSLMEKRQLLARQTKKVFRLIYTAIYLTVIMLDVITITAESTVGKESLLVYYGFLFLWVALWGTHCLWIRKVAHWCSSKIYLCDNRLVLFLKENKKMVKKSNG